MLRFDTIVGDIPNLLLGIPLTLAITLVAFVVGILIALPIADAVVFMENGQIIESSPPAQIFAQPKEARTRAFLERLLEREGGRDG